MNRTFRTFEQARTFARALGLRSGPEWSEWAKGPQRTADIPADPSKVYKNRGWADMGDWLGTRNIAPQDHAFLPFEEARAIVRALGLKGWVEWNDWTRGPQRVANVPTMPDRVYKDQGWAGMGDWLGIEGLFGWSVSAIRAFVAS